MGTSVCIECESCKYSKSLMEGVGMLYDDLDYLISIMEPIQRKDVSNIRKNHDATQVGSSMRIYTCPQCHTLSNHLDLKLNYCTSGTYQTQYRCEQCESVLMTVTSPLLSDYCCSKCGKNTLIESSIIAGELWD